MENTQPNEPRRGQAAGTWWLVQAISGLLLILVLGLHMIAQHFLVEGGLREFADVIAYVSNPLIFAIEIVFLVVVTTHAVLGARAICLDLGLSERGERAVNWIVALVGIAAVGYGIWLAISIQSLA
jgi:succinate dehydrogenase / fumarate reductase membrane anchor subunit